jgi:hypothetical protein
MSPSGEFLGVIGGSNQAVLRGQVVVDFALVPDVIPAGENVNAQLQQLFRYERGDPEAARGILAVRDHEVDIFSGNDVVESVGDDASSRGSEDIADEEDVH